MTSIRKIDDCVAQIDEINNSSKEYIVSNTDKVTIVKHIVFKYLEVLVIFIAAAGAFFLEDIVTNNNKP